MNKLIEWSKTEVKGKTRITVTTTDHGTRGFWLWKRSTKTITEKTYEAQERIVSHFWKWLELPNYTLVPDSMSFQLDAWKAV